MYGTPGTLSVVPDMSPMGLGKEVEALAKSYVERDRSFREWQSLLDMVDLNKGGGLESMVTNDARTMFTLSTFLSSAVTPRRRVAIGSQGGRADKASGESERALTSWWDFVDQQRIASGYNPFQQDLAYWMCLYGWYAVQFMMLKGKDGEPIPIAVPLDPGECYPFYADGLDRFVRHYDTTFGQVHRLAINYGVQPPSGTNAKKKVSVADWYWRTPGDEVVHAVLVNGLPDRRSWSFIKEPYVVEGVSKIPVLVGKVSGSPGGQGETGSVLWENEGVYKNFNRWLSFLMTLTREHAQAPVIAHNILDLDEEKLRPLSIRGTGAVITTDDPEARIERVQTGPNVVEVQQFLGIIDGMLQRGGFPYLVYGGLGRELSGFAISQLLQAAERRIGPQVRRLALVDGLVSQHWLERFRDGEFAEATVSGYEDGNPRKSFVEDFTPKNVPEKFRVVTEVPIRVGNDLMARMAIARQALGTAAPLLDHATILDEILEMQDPALIVDRITGDEARKLELPLRVAIELKKDAAVLRAEGGPGTDEAAKLLEQMAEGILQQDRQQGGAQPRQRVAPQDMPPEAFGTSPDAVRAARSEGPTNVREE